MITRIAHVAYRVTDMEKAIRFYCDGLGLQQKFSLKDPEGKPWIEYLEIVPLQFLELFYDSKNQKAQEKDPDCPGYLHLSLETDNLKELREELISRGIQPDGEIKMQNDHTWQMWVTDSDGNRIEFMEYTEESLQRK